MKKKKIHVPIILLLFILLLLMLLLFLSTSQLACLKWNVNSNNFTYFIWRNTFFFLSLGWSLARSLFLWKKYLNRQNDIFHHVNSSSIYDAIIDIPLISASIFDNLLIALYTKKYVCIFAFVQLLSLSSLLLLLHLI